MTYLVWAAVFAMFVVVLLGYFLGCLNGSVLVSHFIIRDDVRQHLAELGFVVGTEVTVVSELGGNLILSVKESRVALDKTMAMRIMV